MLNGGSAKTKSTDPRATPHAGDAIAVRDRVTREGAGFVARFASSAIPSSNASRAQRARVSCLLWRKFFSTRRVLTLAAAFNPGRLFFCFVRGMTSRFIRGENCREWFGHHPLDTANAVALVRRTSSPSNHRTMLRRTRSPSYVSASNRLLPRMPQYIACRSLAQAVGRQMYVGFSPSVKKVAGVNPREIQASNTCPRCDNEEQMKEHKMIRQGSIQCDIIRTSWSRGLKPLTLC